MIGYWGRFYASFKNLIEALEPSISSALSWKYRTNYEFPQIVYFNSIPKTESYSITASGFLFNSLRIEAKLNKLFVERDAYFERIEFWGWAINYTPGT